MSGSLIREYHETTEDDDKIKIINTAVKLIKKMISHFWKYIDQFTLL